MCVLALQCKNSTCQTRSKIHVFIWNVVLSTTLSSHTNVATLLLATTGMSSLYWLPWRYIKKRLFQLSGVSKISSVSAEASEIHPCPIFQQLWNSELCEQSFCTNVAVWPEDMHFTYRHFDAFCVVFRKKSTHSMSLSTHWADLLESMQSIWVPRN